MRTQELRRRLHVLGELGLYHVLMGEAHADPVQERAIFLPPFRDRLADGRLGPTYGTPVLSRWQSAWVAWHQSRAGGGLWDAQTDLETRRAERPKPAPAPHPVALFDMEVFLSRYGHEMTARELQVASLRWRDRLKPPAIAKRLGMKRPDVDVLLRSVIQRWMQVVAARAGA